MLNERNTLLEDDGIEEEILVEEECSVAQAVWGDIQGDIENQTDLQNALDAKQDSLTEAQLNAVNSGITAEKVTTYDGYADQIASKADQSALNAESIARGEADTALGTRIDNEALARQNADNGLQSQIDAITSKSDVVDVVANYAALQAYDTSTLGNNDVIKVLDDETHEDALTYYRWSTTTQTWSYIGQEAPYYSKGQMDVKLAEKQDKLTAGANIQIQNGTISATDTTYMAGNGLNLNGTEFSADTDILATKEDIEDYYTKPETDNLLAPKLEAEVVAELPATGEEGKLYLTPKAHTTQTATGNPITATVAEEAGAIESFQLDGDTFQQSYEGKNLWGGFASDFRKTNSGITFVNHADGTITANGTATGTALSIFSTEAVSQNRLITLSAGDYIISGATDVVRLEVINTSGGVVGDTSGSVSGAKDFSISEQMQVAVRAKMANTYVADNVTIKPMLEAGSTASDYEPYVGGQPSPSPDYPQQIQTVTGLQTVEIVGKNKYPFNDIAWSSTQTASQWSFQNGSTNAYGANITDKTAYKFTLPAGTYTMTAFDISSNIINIQACTNGESSETIVTSPSNINSENLSSTITLTETTTLCVRYRTTNPSLGIGNTKIQIEQAESASSFAPYSKQTLSLDLGNTEICKLGNYQDYILKDGNDWKVHKATSQITLDGVVGTYSNISNLGSYTRVRVSVGTGKVNGIGESDMFVFKNAYAEDSAHFYVYNNFFWIFVPTAELSSIDENGVRAWFAEFRPTFYYALATATDTVITDTTLIAQLEAIRTAMLQNGANTITNTATGSNLAGDMEIGYYGFAPRNRYDKWLWLDINNEYEQIGS